MKFLDCGFGIKSELLPGLTQVFTKTILPPQSQGNDVEQYSQYLLIFTFLSPDCKFQSSHRGSQAYLLIMNQNCSEKPQPQNVNNWEETGQVFPIPSFNITKNQVSLSGPNITLSTNPRHTPQDCLGPGFANDRARRWEMMLTPISEKLVFIAVILR